MNNEGTKPQYRRLLLADEVTFTLKAVDACMFMAWAMQQSIDTDMVDHIFANSFGPQFEQQLFVTASIRAARAQMAEDYEDAVKRASTLVGSIFHGPIVVVCDVCGSRDEYTSLPFGELTCGHDGPRHGFQED